MPRTRSPDSIKAEQMYRKGIKLVDIGKSLGVPASTVRRWKSTQDWDGKGKKKQPERSDKEAGNKTSARKRGAPKGNHNAKGNKGSLPGNKKALKHGGYSQIYWDTLDDDERELIETTPHEEEELLINQIMLYTVRERRLMKAINKYKDADNVYVAGVVRSEDKRSFKSDEDRGLYDERIQERIDQKARLPGEGYHLQTTTSATIDLVARLERELTSVQSQKTKAIDALAKLRLEKQKIEGESKGNDLVRTWADAVLKARRDPDG